MSLSIPSNSQRCLVAFYVLNFRNLESRRPGFWVGGLRLQMAAQEKTIKTHSESQVPLLLFNDCGTELSKGSRTCLAVTHTTDGSATYRDIT